MKTKGLRTLLASVAALALVGTGYAAWQFNTVVNNEVSAVGKVTAAIEAESVDVEIDGVDTLYLIMDACKDAGHNHAAGNGIYWAKDAEGKNAVTELTLTGHVNYDANDIVDFSGYVGHFEVTADLSTNSYVTFGSTTNPADVAVTSNYGDCVTTYTLPVPFYVTCPGSVENVNKLTDGLTDLKFTVNFNVKEVTNA